MLLKSLSKHFTTKTSTSLRSFATRPAHPKILIKNGTAVNADRQYKADITIEGGKISGVYE